MDLAYDYLARTTHERNVAAADRINAYRRRVAERRALEAASLETAPAQVMSPENASPETMSAQAIHSSWSRVLRALAPSRSHGHDAALPGRP
jgi:hypothetical protein